MRLSQLIGARIYLDTNVWIYAREDARHCGQAARAIFDLIERGQIRALTSEFTLAEALVAPIRDKDRAAQNHYIAALQSVGNLHVQPPTRRILSEAARLTALTELTMPDALHAATAKIGGAKYFVTNDEGFLTVTALDVALLSRLDLEH